MPSDHFTHKLCELIVADASMCPLETLWVHLLFPFCVDVTETNGGQDLYWGWLLLEIKGQAKLLHIMNHKVIFHHKREKDLAKNMCIELFEYPYMLQIEGDVPDEGFNESLLESESFLRIIKSFIFDLRRNKVKFGWQQFSSECLSALRMGF